MYKSLYSKLAMGLAGLFLIVGLIFVLLTVYSTEMYQQEVNQKLNINLANQIVSKKLLMKDNRVNQKALEEIFDMMMLINPGIEIYLLDPEGNILSFSAPKGKVKIFRVDLNPVKKWLSGDMTIPLIGDDPRNPAGKKVFSVAPIMYQDKIEGYLYIILGGEIYDSVVEKLRGSYILQLSSWMIAAGLLFALIAGLILFAVLTGRLRRLADVMDAFKSGEKIKRIEFPIMESRIFPDEIDRLGVTFKDMAIRLESQLEELQNSDTLRRELIANISHDLKTPLATLQGYIETLLIKQEELGKEEKKQYLEIAIKHCKRLSGLVNELLELAKLDSYEMKIQIESFNLCELVQDVIRKFELRAHEKQIKIFTSFQKDLPFAKADIGLIERALENLLENAIHYTPLKGSIKLILTLEQNDISIQVSDTGSGIPENELPHIFNRFYQLDKYREKEVVHSGLGLAITKKILELHGKSIMVASSLGKGTTFTFYVPADNTI